MHRVPLRQGPESQILILLTLVIGYREGESDKRVPDGQCWGRIDGTGVKRAGQMPDVGPIGLLGYCKTPYCSFVTPDFVKQNENTTYNMTNKIT
jgi:hypothetical protein